MKEKYLSPEMDVIKFETEDVITTSVDVIKETDPNGLPIF